MKQIILFLLCIIFSACENNEEKTILYKQLLNYRNDLKMDVKSKDFYILTTLEDNKFFNQRYDSLNKIKLDLEKSFDKVRYTDKKKILEIRDNFNNKYKLNVKFPSGNYDANITDSIFNRLVEVDFLRLIRSFQDEKMFIHGDKF
ncbi:hypothetical protein [Flavobacterium pectinovorum]|uniref:Uncharacterized protein n=1 Tax=Flavobacterium pectinovorum TaxID=29533 RepID=A0A502E174_9FLAO|nr:hypothetical protein [Flavobacterium pectinovorum]TPG31353.1 hypothetical protein EAH81_26875 [Flavobacterium pectinovorum]